MELLKKSIMVRNSNYFGFEILFRCSRNLKATTLILIGTVPLATYQSLLVSPEDSKTDRYPPSAPPPIGFGFEPSSSAPPDYSVAVNLPTRNFSLRKRNYFLLYYK